MYHLFFTRWKLWDNMYPSENIAVMSCEFNSNPQKLWDWKELWRVILSYILLMSVVSGRWRSMILYSFPPFSNVYCSVIPVLSCIYTRPLVRLLAVTLNFDMPRVCQIFPALFHYIIQKFQQPFYVRYFCLSFLLFRFLVS